MTYKTKSYQMYSAETSRDIRNFVTDSFTQEDDTIRFLAASVVFGMEIDCKGLNCIYI